MQGGRQDPSVWVDLERYPITSTVSLRYRQLVAAARLALLGVSAQEEVELPDLGQAGGGVCMLPGFFKDEAIRLSIDDALRTEPLAFRSDNEHNIYLEEEEEEEETASAPETTTSASQGCGIVAPLCGVRGMVPLSDRCNGQACRSATCCSEPSTRRRRA